VRLDYDSPFIGLDLLRNAVNCAAPDGKLIYALFVVVVSQSQIHFTAVAELVGIPRDSTFRALLAAWASSQAILARAELLARRLEEESSCPA